MSYDLALHHGGSAGKTLRIVFATTEEPFQRWLFYLLRDIGAHIVTDEPEELRAVLGVSRSEPGILGENEATRSSQPQHAAAS
jgi:hypothetical protein